MSLTVTDLFCGAGGSSVGATMAGAELRLGLNHWERAIETHARNFPDAEHDCEDVSSLTTAQIRRYPDSDILLASPECTNHSLAKGAQRRKPQAPSLFDDGPAGDAEQDRSRATMWDVVRFTEQKLLKGRPYRVVIVENVVDAFKWGYNDDGGLFAAWRQAMTALGYMSEIVWLNSMFAPPTPQSRDRMYVVFWQRSVRRPDLNVRPRSWCPTCETLVSGLQAWKKPDRPWGRYGQQYLYVCPDCHGYVLPGVYPAASAIDWGLIAPRIGDRGRPLAANTRERIRRGLARLQSEPFAIRLLQGGQPRPLTLPIVTLTQRHDLAMVIPVAGNTFERTPGNRARDAGVSPMDTLHGTLDRALVVAYSEDGVARVADREPAQTQRTNPTLSLVVGNRAHNVPKIADEEPSPPILTGGTVGVVHLRQHGDVKPIEEPIGTVSAGGFHHGLVMRNNTGGGEMSTPVREPFRTLTAACHQSLIVPYQSEPHGPEEPVRTVTTRDRLSLVVPPSTNGQPRIAQLEPSFVQVTETRPALVEVTDLDIDGCGFRMFELHEIARTMAMHEHADGADYIVVGNKRERMAQYGNAVTPPVMRLLVERCVAALDEKVAA